MTQAGKRRRRRPNVSRGKRDSHEQGLMPWHEIAAVWERRTGERLSKGVVWYICRNAERKLRAALKGAM